MPVALTVLLVGLLVVFWLRSKRQAFVLKVLRGKVTLLKGTMPGAMLNDFQSALKNVSSGVVRGHFEEGGLRVTVSGQIDEWTEQRLRNITHLYPLAKFRASRESEKQALKATGILSLFSFFSTKD